MFCLIRKVRPHIVHGVLFWAYVIGTYVARTARVPVVVASRRSLGLFKSDKPHYLFLERLAARLTDLFIANSEAVRRDTIEREHLDPRRVLVVHNGVDFSRFDHPCVTAGAECVGTGPRVIVVSNLIHYKGHEHFLRAWRELVARVPSATALLVGEGVMRRELEALTRQLGVQASVQFLGRRTDVPQLLASSDVYVHPSLEEGYSNAVLEAMAAGRAVIATKVGGNAEAVSDGETGVLVPPADSAALASQMIRLLENPVLRNDLGARAAEAVRQHFDIQTIVRRYEEVYRRLAAGERLEYEPATNGINRCVV